VISYKDIALQIISYSS